MVVPDLNPVITLPPAVSSDQVVSDASATNELPFMVALSGVVPVHVKSLIARGSRGFTIPLDALPGFAL